MIHRIEAAPSMENYLCALASVALEVARQPRLLPHFVSLLKLVTATLVRSVECPPVRQASPLLRRDTRGGFPGRVC